VRHRRGRKHDLPAVKSQTFRRLGGGRERRLRVRDELRYSGRTRRHKQHGRRVDVRGAGDGSFRALKEIVPPLYAAVLNRVADHKTCIRCEYVRFDGGDRGVELGLPDVK